MVTFSRIETSTIPSCYPKHYARKPICFECYVQEIFACDGADFVCFEEKCVFHFVVCVMDVLPTLQFLSLFFMMVSLGSMDVLMLLDFGDYMESVLLQLGLRFGTVIESRAATHFPNFVLVPIDTV